MLDVHNNNLFAWDQIAAVFLANSGPVPNLFHEYIFNLIGTKNNTDPLKSNELEKYFVPDEFGCFSQIKTNPIEHSENVDNILGVCYRGKFCN